MAKYISGKFKNLQVGIKGYSEDKLALNIVGIVSAASYRGGGISTTGTSLFNNLNVSGVSTFADKVIIGGGTTDLLVNGDARITGILTIGTSSLTLDGSNNKINVGSAGTIDSTGYKIGDSFVHSTGANIKQLIVSGVSTFAENINANGNIVGDNATNISGINSVTATNLFGALTGNVQGNLTGTVQTASQPNITSLGTLDSLNVTGNVSVGGTLTYEDVTNIDAVGLITARSGIHIPTNKTIGLGDTTSATIEYNSFGVMNRLNKHGATDFTWKLEDEGGPLHMEVRSGTTNSYVQLNQNGNNRLKTKDYGVEITGTTDTDQLIVSGVSTFAGITTVTGDTLFAKNTNFSGITTINHIHILQQLNHITIGPGVSTFTGDLHVYGNLYPQGNVVGDNSTNISGVYDVQILNELNVLGNIVCNNSNITGINSATATSFYGDGSNLVGVALSTILSDAGINTAGLSKFDDLYVSGISTFQSNIHLLDDSYAKFGNDNDLIIGHTAGVNTITIGSTLYLSDSSTNNRVVMNNNGTLEVKDTSGTTKLEVNNSGINLSGITTVGFITATDVWVSGAVTATNYYGDGSNLTGINTSGDAGTWDEIDAIGSTGLYNLRAGEFAAPTLGNQGNYSERNIAIGHSAFGQNVYASSYNVIIGHESGYFTTGDKNTFVGYRAGKNSGQGGGNNTIIGADLDLPLIGGSNQFVIGCGSINIVGVLDKIGIGTTNPQEKLHVVGVVSATSFYGDGSALTGVISGVGIQTESGNVGFGITYLKFIGDGVGEITTPVTGISTINITGAATTTGNIIVPFAYAHIKVEAAGVGIGMTYGAYEGTYGRQEFYFNSAQPNSDYYILSEREQYDTHSVHISNKTTSGFRATWLDNSGTGPLSPSTFPGVLIAYGSDPKTAASVFDTGISTVGTQQFTNLDLSGFLDVDGHTELDNLNVSGISTFQDDIFIGVGATVGFGTNAYFGGTKTNNDGPGIEIGPDSFKIHQTNNYSELISDDSIQLVSKYSGYASLRLSIGGFTAQNNSNRFLASNGDDIITTDSTTAFLHFSDSEKLKTTNDGVEIGTVGISTLGIVTATSFYGDGSNLTGVTASSGVSIKDGGSSVGTASTIDFGTNLSVSALSAGIVTVTASGGGGGGGASGLWESNSTGINTSTNVGIGTTTASDATLTVDVGTGVTAFNVVGSEGSLFSVTNNLSTGSIFSVNDISGIPSFDVDADGTVQIAPFGVNENVGIGITNPQEKLHVVGVVSATSFYGDGSALSGIVAGVGTTSNVNTTGIITALGFNGDFLNITGISTLAGYLKFQNYSRTWPPNNWSSSSEGITVSTVGRNLIFQAGGTTIQRGFVSLLNSGGLWMGGGDGYATHIVGMTSVTGITTFASTVNVGGNLGIGTDDPKFKTHIVGSGSTTLMVEGNARITGILTIGQSSITLDPSSRKLTGLDEVELGQGVNKVVLKKTAKGYMEFVDSNNRDARVAIGTDSDINTVGVVTATRFVGDGSGLTGITATGSGIGIKDSGSVVGTATTIDFGTNLNVSPVTAGIVTVSSTSFTTGKAIAMSMIFG